MQSPQLCLLFSSCTRRNDAINFPPSSLSIERIYTFCVTRSTVFLRLSHTWTRPLEKKVNNQWPFPSCSSRICSLKTAMEGDLLFFCEFNKDQLLSFFPSAFQIRICAASIMVSLSQWFFLLILDGIGHFVTKILSFDLYLAWNFLFPLYIRPTNFCNCRILKTFRATNFDEFVQNREN